MDELFYTSDIEGDIARLSEEESVHCVRVLRHREGDEVFVADGKGTLLRCTLLDASAKGATLRVLEATPEYGRRPYRLVLAVCPTKNNDRYEWMAEKATEIGVDEIVPLIGEHSERRVFRKDRIERVVLSAAKQSLKAYLPEVQDVMSVSEFICGCRSDVRLIAHCEKGLTRISITEALGKAAAIAYCEKKLARTSTGAPGEAAAIAHCEKEPTRTSTGALGEAAAKEICILIGPEGDFSAGEIALAQSSGFTAVHLGPSRLRTETAGVLAAAAVYLTFAI